MLTVFQLYEVRDGGTSIVDYSWDDQDCEISDAIINNKVYSNLSKSKPLGNYSIINKYRLPWNSSLIQLMEFDDDDTIKSHLRHIVNQDTLVDRMYHQSALERLNHEINTVNKTIKTEPIFQLDTNLKKRESSSLNNTTLFPNNVYIGEILNDGLYLSNDKFFYKYSGIAKAIKNITNELGNYSIKYIIKSNF